MAKRSKASERTLAYYKELGMPLWRVEQWIPNPRSPGGGTRRDLWNFADYLGMCPERGIVAVQSCGDQHSEHIRKFREPAIAAYIVQWLTYGRGRTHLDLISWGKRKVKRGGKAMRYRARIERITIETVSPGWADLME